MKKFVSAAVAAVVGSLLLTAPPSQAAVGSSPDSKNNAYVYVGAESSINVLTDQEHANEVTVCRVATINGETPNYAYVMYGDLFVAAYEQGVTVVQYRTCDDSVVYEPRTVNVRSIRAKEVHFKKIGQKGRTKVFRFTNPNKSVVNADGRVALSGDMTCAYGSFKNSEPDGIKTVRHGASVKIRSRKRPDFICTMMDQGVYAGTSVAPLYRRTSWIG